MTLKNNLKKIIRFFCIMIQTISCFFFSEDCFTWTIKFQVYCSFNAKHILSKCKREFNFKKVHWSMFCDVTSIEEWLCKLLLIPYSWFDVGIGKSYLWWWIHTYFAPQGNVVAEFVFISGEVWIISHTVWRLKLLLCTTCMYIIITKNAAVMSGVWS
jgi:hypothetical protein